MDTRGTWDIGETGDTGEDIGDTRGTWDIGLTGLTGPTILRHDLTEISPKMDKLSNSYKF